MTSLIKREEIAKSKQIISSELAKIQRAFYDEEIFQSYKEDNEEHLYIDSFDFYNEKISDYNVHNKIIGLNHKDINTFTTVLSNKLIELFQKFGITELYIISHLKRDFFGNRDNDFNPLVNAYKKLETIVGKKTYKEAFKFSINNLPDFIDILFWITRCDMSVAEYIFLFDEKEKIQVNLCKYGNIHLSEFGNEVLTKNVLNSLDWLIIERSEVDNFTENKKIEGRELKM